MIRTPSGPFQRPSTDLENPGDAAALINKRKVTAGGPFSPQPSGRAFGTNRPTNVDTFPREKVAAALSSPSSASTNSRGISRNPPSPFSGTVITGISLGGTSGTKPESPPVSLEALQLAGRVMPHSLSSDAAVGLSRSTSFRSTASTVSTSSRRSAGVGPVNDLKKKKEVLSLQSKSSITMETAKASNNSSHSAVFSHDHRRFSSIHEEPSFELLPTAPEEAVVVHVQPPLSSVPSAIAIATQVPSHISSLGSVSFDLSWNTSQSAEVSRGDGANAPYPPGLLSSELSVLSTTSSLNPPEPRLFPPPEVTVLEEEKIIQAPVPRTLKTLPTTQSLPAFKMPGGPPSFKMPGAKASRDTSVKGSILSGLRAANPTSLPKGAVFSPQIEIRVPPPRVTTSSEMAAPITKMDEVLTTPIDSEHVIKAADMTQETKAPVLLTFSPPVRQGARTKPPPAFLARLAAGQSGAQVPKPESSIAPKQPLQQKRNRVEPSTPLPAASGTLPSNANFTPASAPVDQRSPEEIVAALTKRQQIKLASGLLSPRHMLELGIIHDEPSVIQATPGEPALSLSEFGIVSVKKKKLNDATDFSSNAIPEADKFSRVAPPVNKTSATNRDEKLVFEFSPGPLRNRKATKTHTFKVSRTIAKPPSGAIAPPPPLPAVKPMPQSKSLQRSSSSSSVISAMATTAMPGSKQILPQASIASQGALFVTLCDSKSGAEDMKMREAVIVTNWINSSIEPQALVSYQPAVVPQSDSAAGNALALHAAQALALQMSAANDANSAALLFAVRREARLKRAAFKLYYADEATSATRVAILADVAAGRLMMRPEAAPLVDAGLRSRLTDLFCSVNPAWMKLALETVMGEDIHASASGTSTSSTGAWWGAAKATLSSTARAGVKRRAQSSTDARRKRSNVGSNRFSKQHTRAKSSVPSSSVYVPLKPITNLFDPLRALSFRVRSFITNRVFSVSDADVRKQMSLTQQMAKEMQQMKNKAAASSLPTSGRAPRAPIQQKVETFNVSTVGKFDPRYHKATQQILLSRMLGLLLFIDSARTSDGGSLAGLSVDESAELQRLFPHSLAGSEVEHTLAKIQASLVLPPALFVPQSANGRVASSSADDFSLSSLSSSASSSSRSPAIRSSRDLVTCLCREILRSSEGDVLRHLMALGMNLSYTQSKLDEIKWAVSPPTETTTFDDIRDGSRLIRLAEVLTSQPPLSLARMALILPATNRTSRLHNIQEGLQFFSAAFEIDLNGGVNEAVASVSTASTSAARVSLGRNGKKIVRKTTKSSSTTSKNEAYVADGIPTYLSSKLSTRVKVQAKDIVDGGVEKMSALLASIFISAKLPTMLSADRVRDEAVDIFAQKAARDAISLIRRTPNVDANALLTMPSELPHAGANAAYQLLTLFRAISAFHGVPMPSQGFSFDDIGSSCFADGRILCSFISHYRPHLLPRRLFSMQTTAQLVSPPAASSASVTSSGGARGKALSTLQERAKNRRSKSAKSNSPNQARIMFRPGVTSKQVSAALEAERKNFHLINDAAGALGCAHVSLGICDTTHPPTTDSVLIFGAHIAAKLLRDPTGKENMLSLSTLTGAAGNANRGAYRPPRDLLETFAASIVANWYRAKLPTLGIRRERRAAVVIQSVIRMCLCKRLLKQLKDKREARRAAAKKRFAVRRDAAKCIAYAMMANAARCIYKRKLSSALTLQAFWRGASCRRYFSRAAKAIRVIQRSLPPLLLRMRLRFRADQRLDRLGSAVTLQAVWRGFMAQRNFSLLKRSIISVQRSFRLRQNRMLREETAAESARLLRERAEAAEMLLVRRTCAVTMIQAAVKGHLGRNLFLLMKGATATIQSTFRMYYTRKTYLMFLENESRFKREEEERTAFAAEAAAIAAVEAAERERTEAIASFEAAERERSVALLYVETVSTDHIAIDTDAMNEELLQIQRGEEKEAEAAILRAQAEIQAEEAAAALLANPVIRSRSRAGSRAASRAGSRRQSLGGQSTASAAAIATQAAEFVVAAAAAAVIASSSPLGGSASSVASYGFNSRAAPTSSHSARSYHSTNSVESAAIFSTKAADSSPALLSFFNDFNRHSTDGGSDSLANPIPTRADQLGYRRQIEDDAASIGSEHISIDITFDNEQFAPSIPPSSFEQLASSIPPSSSSRPSFGFARTSFGQSEFDAQPSLTVQKENEPKDTSLMFVSEARTHSSVSEIQRSVVHEMNGKAIHWFVRWRQAVRVCKNARRDELSLTARGIAKIRESDAFRSFQRSVRAAEASREGGSVKQSKMADLRNSIAARLQLAQAERAAARLRSEAAAKDIAATKIAATFKMASQFRVFMFTKGACMCIQNNVRKFLLLRQGRLDRLAFRQEQERLVAEREAEIALREAEEAEADAEAREKIERAYEEARRSASEIEFRNKNASVLQAVWKGRNLRSAITDKHILIAQKRIRSAAINASRGTEKTIMTRCEIALSNLASAKSLSSAMLALCELEVTLRLAQVACANVFVSVNGAPTLVAITKSLGRSDPHKQMMRKAFAILRYAASSSQGNASKLLLGGNFEVLKLCGSVLQTFRDSLEVVRPALDLMTMLLSSPAALQFGNGLDGDGNAGGGGARRLLGKVLPQLPRQLATTANLYRSRIALATRSGSAAIGGGVTDDSVLYEGLQRGRENFSLGGTLKAYEELLSLL